MADLGMPVTSLLAGAAEGHALQNRNVILDHRRLADHKAGGVIEEHALANARGGVDVAPEHSRREALQAQGEIAPARLQEPMGEPIGLQRLEAFEKDQRSHSSRTPGL